MCPCSSNLLVHERRRSHTGEKRYACSFAGCDRRFAHPASRNTHEKCVCVSVMFHRHVLPALCLCAAGIVLVSDVSQAPIINQPCNLLRAPAPVWVSARAQRFICSPPVFRRTHVDGEAVSFPCTAVDCGLVFDVPAKLAQHVKVHHKEMKGSPAKLKRARV